MNNTEEELAQFLGGCFRSVIIELERQRVAGMSISEKEWTAAGRGFLRGLKRQGLVMTKMPGGFR